MIKTVPISLCHSCGSELQFVIILLPRCSDYTFILSTIFRSNAFSYRLAPKLFIEYANSIVSLMPLNDRCLFSFIKPQISLNFSKSFAFDVCKGNLVKCGIILYNNSFKLRTSYLYVWSLLLNLIPPQPRYSQI